MGAAGRLPFPSLYPPSSSMSSFTASNRSPGAALWSSLICRRAAS
ncbi:hypothetical protein HMPREF0239_03058 [Clostridium sp. ATCC BAA-442]|nr:hypothetical protein HMPREF0239_03058 [Clostridium sp. ATCC BAA-442]